MKKRFVATILLVVLAMSIVLTGCSSNDSETGSDVSSNVDNDDNTTVNNDTDINNEIDTSKQEDVETEEEIEYAEDDVIITIGTVSFSIYDEFETVIEPKLQAAGFDTSAVREERILYYDVNGIEKMTIGMKLREIDNGLYISLFLFDTKGEKGKAETFIKINGYDLTEREDIIKKYEFELDKNGRTKEAKYITDDVKLSVYKNKLQLNRQF